MWVCDGVELMGLESVDVNGRRYVYIPLRTLYEKSGLVTSWT